MRTLKLALASALAAFAYNANAQAAKNGLGTPPTGYYQPLGVSATSNVPGTLTGGIDQLGFHAGGVAACDGCHVMHNANPGPGAQGGAKSTTGLAGEPAWSNHTNAYLLQGSDQSSTCLICHGSTGAQSNMTPWVVADLSAATNGATAPRWRSPGGDFGWTRVDFAGMGPNANASSPGGTHGHNVFAGDWNWDLDGRFTVAPGGTWPSGGTRNTEKFACSSCHDPHGRFRIQTTGTSVMGAFEFRHPAYTGGAMPIIGSGSYGELPADNQTAVGVYRLLGGKSYEPASKGGYPFTYDPPVAVAPTDYNRTEAANEVRVSYATGMSEWCKNCHTEIHSDTVYSSGWSGLRHPAASTAAIKPAQATVYNTYISTARYDSAGTEKYTSLVPFERGTTITGGYAQLRTDANAGTGFSATGGNVMCLSCHRAHASAFDSMVRWDQNATFLTGSNAIAEGIVARTGPYLTAGYYGRGVATTPGTWSNGTTLGPYQRSLCNKCHGKD
jgi:predicted CXXCH cytochrome family protein